MQRLCTIHSLVLNEGQRLGIYFVCAAVFIISVQLIMLRSLTLKIANVEEIINQTERGSRDTIEMTRLSASQRTIGMTTNYATVPGWKSTRANYEYIEGANMFCTVISNWTLPEHLGRVTSDMKSWTFQQTTNCPQVNISETRYPKPRFKLSLNCRRNNINIISKSWTNVSSDIYVASFGHNCVNTFIQNCCIGGYRVPNVVHYVWYRRGELTFVGFTSLLSVIRFVKPCVIMFHGDDIPYGKYWDYIVNLSPNIIHIKRECPEFISGQRIKHKEHSSDIMRIEALLEYGGIYMDTDTIMVKSVESLRNYSCVMSNQSSGLMGSAFVMAERNASFIQLWMDGYRYHYNNLSYVYNAMVYPKKMVLSHNDLIHIEYGTVSRPINMIGGKIYDNLYATYDWSYIYGIHLYSRIFRKPFNEHTIRTMNTTTGSICRHVIFGNKEMCS